MIFITLILVNLIFSKCDLEVLEDRSVDEDDPKLFHGYLFKKMKQRIPDIIQRWKSFKTRLRLRFSGEENKYRFFTFAKNIIFINDFMQENSSSFEVAENDFAYLSREEYFKMLGSFVPEAEDSEQEILTLPELESRQSKPQTIDWRSKNAVTPVKNQLNCGGCYAFTAAAAVESAIAIKTGKLQDLSEQEIIDCSGKYGNLGCNGGVLAYTYKYFMDQSVANENSYPFTGAAGQCKNAPDFAMKIKSYKSVKSGDEAGLSNAILTVGPVGVAIDSRPSSFRFYKSGIYRDPACSSSSLNHGVTVIGVMDQYYIVKNSWSVNWGMKGYVHIARNSGNVCGIASAAVYPLL